MTNVGVRPTVEDNDGHVTVEGFILDFDGDLYGHEIRMEFYKYLRPEQCFPSMDALAAEIRRNAPADPGLFPPADLIPPLPARRSASRGLSFQEDEIS